VGEVAEFPASGTILSFMMEFSSSRADPDLLYLEEGNTFV
jgi:hypothetical protein